MRHVLLGFTILANLIGCRQTVESLESNDAPDLVLAIESYNLEKYAGIWSIESTVGTRLDLEITQDGYYWQASNSTATLSGDYGRIQHMPDQLSLISQRSECLDGSGKTLRYVLQTQLLQNELKLNLAKGESINLARMDALSRTATLDCPSVSGDVVEIYRTGL
ncbi:MAG: hypothetical protein ACOVS5_16525 [Oligoflexus sp.]|jgi:hypothetical protein